MAATVTVVLDYPHQHTRRRVWRAVRALIGSLMVLLAASPVILLFIFVALFPDVMQQLGQTLWCIAPAIMVLSSVVGLRLIQGKRKLVLFLRRFGFTEATGAITFAVARTTGRFWRLVTLDDAAIAPVGVATSMRRFFRAVSFVGAGIYRAWGIIIITALNVMGFAIAGMLCLVVITFLRHDDLATLFDHFSHAGGALSWDIPSAFYILFYVTIGVAIGVLPLSLLVLPLVPFMGYFILFASSSQAVRRAEESKRAEIRNTREIEAVTRLVAEESRRIFSPKLVVLKVDSNVWKQTVSSLASLTSVPLIDVSEPTENLLWEIQELTGQFGSRCAFVGNYDRVRRLAAGAEEGPSPGAFNDRLAILLDGQEVLAYTTDRAGMKRFARALRTKFLTLSG